jgi:hypothetical protein
MKTVLLAAGALALTLGAGEALAKHHSASGAAAAGPAQPIPYAQLDTYLKASPSQRAKKDWWSGTAVASGGAESSSGANASATTSSTTTEAQPAPAANPAPSTSETPK